jgi:7-cyano-7-deazaguanine reductase
MPEENNEDVFNSVVAGLRQLEPDSRKKAFSIIKNERQAELKARKDELALLPNTHFSKAHLLKKIPNPSFDAYEQKIFIPEFTFIGVVNQPDFGELLLTFYPNKWTIELKSLKLYKDAFREVPASYERLANVIFDDVMSVYEPQRLRLMMKLRPRGGISSCLTIDSDWAIRGGNEQFRDWGHNTDAFGFDAVGTTTLN